MILNDFLSWQKNDDSDTSKIIPISFNVYGILEENKKIYVCKIKENSLFRLTQAKQVVSDSWKYME